MAPLLWTSYFRYLRKNLWLLFFSLFAIATGVCVVLAIDVASISAQRSFALSLQALTGSSNYTIRAASGGIDEKFFSTLRKDWGIRNSAPVVEGYLSFPESMETGRLESPVALTLLGVEPFSDSSLRAWTGGSFSNSSSSRSQGLNALIGSTNRVVATASTAQKLNWEVGQSRKALVGHQSKELVLAGTFQADSERSAQALDNILLTDISVAQAIFERYGVVDRIDLKIDDEELKFIKEGLPKELSLQESGQSQKTAQALSAAFHTNLRALSYLCLLVAGFLIFNVVSFSVSHRRQSLARLRILGVTASELGKLLVGEALILGFIGSLFGCFMGLVLGRVLVPLVTRTLNDLYYVHSISSFAIDPLLVLKAFSCGLLATILAALVPAVSAARLDALELLHRVNDRDHNKRWAKMSFVGGVALFILSGVVLYNPSLGASLLSLLFMVFAWALFVPLALLVSVKLMSPLLGRVSHAMAVRGITAFLPRTSLATISLTLAVAATISIGMMVSSFRGTLVSWLETTLSADIYLSLKDRAGLNSGAHLDPQSVEKAIQIPGVSDWIGQRLRRLPSDSGETYLVAVRTGGTYRDSLVFLEKADSAWDRFHRGEGVFVTEPYARRQKFSVGSKLGLATPQGKRDLEILGIYYSYAPDRNLALYSSQAYEELFSDDKWSGLGLYLRDQETSTEVVSQLQSVFGDGVEIHATGNLRALALEIFERTFTVTKVLRFLALGIAFVAVCLSLLALAFERSAELRTMRALGLSRGEIFTLALTQSLSLGFFAGLFSFPLGVMLSWMMIKVINQRAFGWTIGFLTDFGAAWEALGLAMFAALLAGLYPAWYWSRQAEGEALRERE